MLVDWLVSSFALQMFYVRLVDTHHIEIQGEEKAQEAARNLYKNETIKSIVNTLWNEVKRMKNPHKYYVDLSQELWNLKDSMLHNL